MTIKFEVNSSYIARPDYNWNEIYPFVVVKRTAKTVWVKNTNHGEVEKKKIYLDKEGSEYVSYQNYYDVKASHPFMSKELAVWLRKGYNHSEAELMIKVETKRLNNEALTDLEIWGVNTIAKNTRLLRSTGLS